MARYTKEHKQQTRTQILRAARRMLQTQGVEGTAIPALMAEAGLTHGGFYAHFRNKTDLLAAVAGEALKRRSAQLTAAAAEPHPAAALGAFVDYYLSAAHRADQATGCILPALTADLTRQEPEVRHALTGALTEYVASIAALLPDGAAQTRDDQALVLAAGMTGALLLARAVDDPQLSDRILTAAHDFYKTQFVPEGSA